MLYYNYRVTGNALLMPYALNEAQYGASPVFWMMRPGRPPVYRHEVVRRFWEEWDTSYYRLAREWPPRLLIPFLVTLTYFLTPVSVLALFTAVFLRGGRKVRAALAIRGRGGGSTPDGEVLEPALLCARDRDGAVAGDVGPAICAGKVRRRVR